MLDTAALTCTKMQLSSRQASVFHIELLVLKSTLCPDPSPTFHEQVNSTPSTECIVRGLETRPHLLPDRQRHPAGPFQTFIINHVWFTAGLEAQLTVASALHHESCIKRKLKWYNWFILSK